MPTDPLDHALRAAAVQPDASASGQRWAAIEAHLAAGWNPEAIAWQRWLMRWWPWVLAVSAATAAGTALGTLQPHPPAGGLPLFSEPPAPPR